MKKIGLLGCGAIGMQIAQAIDSGTIPAKLVSVYDQDEKRASALIAKLSDKPRMAQNAHMLSSEDVDLVVEAASQEKVRYSASLQNTGFQRLQLQTILWKDSLLLRL